jgi:hypothetical protein
MRKVFSIRHDKPFVSLLKYFKQSQLVEMGSEQSSIVWCHKGKYCLIQPWVIVSVTNFLESVSKHDNTWDAPIGMDQICFNDQAPLDPRVAEHLFTD